MFFGPKTLPLDLSDNNMRLHIELDRYEIEAIDDFDKHIQFQYRKNIVLTYYNYDDADGNWGSVGEHYVTTMDLQNIASGLQELITHKKNSFEYKTVIEEEIDNPFMILCCKNTGNLFSLNIQIAEGRFREWLVVELTQLSYERFNEYVQLFMQWAKDYPVLSEEELSIAREIPW